MKVKHNYSMWVFILGICIMAGTLSPAFAQDIPITTKSEQANELFTEGRELFDNLRFDEARETFDLALQEDPNFALANVYRALASTTDSEFIAHLSKAVSAKSEVSEGERLLIESIEADANNKPMQGITSLEKAVELYPQDKRLHHMLGIGYLGMDKDELAEKQFNKAIQIDANFAPAYNNLGYLYRNAEQYTKAEEAFKNYIRLLPNEANPHDSIGDLYTKTGKHDLAIEHYQKALELNPTFYYSQQKIGDNLIFKGLYEDGRKAYQQAIEIAPAMTNKIFLQQALANTYLYEHNLERALAESDKAVKWAEENSLPENAATLHQMRAFIKIEKGLLNDAEKDLIACENIMENETLTENRQQTLELFALRNKAIQAAKKGDFDRAMETAEKVRLHAEQSMNPNEMETYYLVSGIAHLEAGDFSNAVEMLKQSNSNSPYAQFYLAKSYQKAGMKDEARELFSKVARWNEGSMEYALVRNNARAASGLNIAVEED